MSIISSKTEINWRNMTDDIFLWLKDKDPIAELRLYDNFKNITKGLMIKHITWFPEDYEEEIIQDACFNTFGKILQKIDPRFKLNSTVIYFYVQSGIKMFLRDRIRKYNSCKKKEEKAFFSYLTMLKCGENDILFDEVLEDIDYVQQILDEALDSLKNDLADDAQSILILDCIKNNNLYYILMDVKSFSREFNINDSFKFKHKLCNLFIDKLKDMLPVTVKEGDDEDQSEESKRN